MLTAASFLLSASIGCGLFVMGYLCNGYFVNSEGMWALPSERKRRNSEQTNEGVESAADPAPQQTQDEMRGDGDHATFENEAALASSCHGSTTIPSHECHLMTGCDNVQSAIRKFEIAQASLDSLKCRSARDKNRADLLASVVTRLNVIDTDVNHLVTEGGYNREDLSATDAVATSVWNCGPTRTGRAQSILSCDSFYSCDDFSDDPDSGDGPFMVGQDGPLQSQIPGGK